MIQGMQFTIEIGVFQSLVKTTFQLHGLKETGRLEIPIPIGIFDPSHFSLEESEFWRAHVSAAIGSFVESCLSPIGRDPRPR
jgi:hypothetical protein